MRARASGVEPFPVAVEGVFNGIWGNRDGVSICQVLDGIGPGITFDRKEFDVVRVAVVMEKGMS